MGFIVGFGEALRRLVAPASQKYRAQEALCLTAAEAETHKKRLLAGRGRNVRFMPVGEKSYTGWIDDSEDDCLVAGVLDIPGFPIFRQPKSEHADGVLAKALDREVQKYLRLCRKLGWIPAKRDPMVVPGLTYDSPAAQAAVEAARELVQECAAAAGDASSGARLACAVVTCQLGTSTVLPN